MPILTVHVDHTTADGVTTTKYQTRGERDDVAAEICRTLDAGGSLTFNADFNNTRVIPAAAVLGVTVTYP